MSQSVFERYKEFVDGEKKFGTEFDWNSQLSSSIDIINLQFTCALKLYASAKSRIKRRKDKSYNEEASVVLIDVCREGCASPDKIIRLLQLGADPNHIRTEDLKSSLHYLVEAAAASSIEALLSCSDAPLVNNADSNGYTPLMIACDMNHSWNQLKMVRLLLSQQDCNLDYVNSRGMSAIALALRDSNVSVVQAVLRAGAGVLSLSSEFLSNLIAGASCSTTTDAAFPSSSDREKFEEEQKEDFEEEKGDDQEELAPPEQYLEDFTSNAYHGSPGIGVTTRRKKPVAELHRETSNSSSNSSTGNNNNKSGSAAAVVHREPSVLHSQELSHSVQSSHSHGAVLEQLMREQCVDYHQPSLSLSLRYGEYFPYRSRMSSALLCQRLVNHRLVEEERQLKKTIARYENKTMNHILQGQQQLQVTEGPQLSAVERRNQRVRRKRGRLSRREQRETVKERRELQLWDTVRARILSRIDKEYNVNQSLKGLFK